MTFNFKKFLKYFSNSLFAFFLFCLIISCEVGLGSAVDTEAPKVSITYPSSNVQAVRDYFVLCGTCSDDREGISVFVTATDSEKKKFDVGVPVVVEDKTWSLKINEKNEDGSYPLKDGRYTFEVMAKDSSGRVSGKSSLTIDIDNTPPLFIVKTPGSVSESTSFGSVLKIEGSISDSHAVKYMGLSVLKPEGEEILLEESDINTAGSTSVTFARFTSDVSKQDELYQNYLKIYDAEKGGYQDLKVKITLRDAAVLCQNPVYEETSSFTESDTVSGNETSSVYLYDSIYGSDAGENALMGSAAGSLNGTGKSFEIEQLMKIQNGTSSYSQEISSKVLQILSRTEVDTSKSGNNLPVRLNKDANPVYQIMGYSFSGDDYSDLSKASKGGTIAFKAESGLDGTNFKPEKIKIYLFGPYILNDVTSSLLSEIYDSPENFSIKYKEKSELLYDGSSEPENSVSVGSWIKSVSLPKELNATKIYFIAATGEDMDNVPFVCDGGNYSGFVVYSNGVPPDVLLESPALESLSNDEENILSIKGSVKSDEGTTINSLRYEIQVSDVLNENKKIGTISGMYGSDSSISLKDGEELGKLSEVHFTIDALNGLWKPEDKVLQDGRKPESGCIYKYQIQVFATTDLEGSSSVSCQVDKKLPEAEITSISPVALQETEIDNGNEVLKYYLNEKITVTANVSESNLLNSVLKVSDGEKTLSYEFGTKTFISQVIDTTEFKDGEISFELEVSDSAGNKNSFNALSIAHHIVDQSSDIPVVEPTNFDSSLDEISKLTAVPDSGKFGNVFAQVSNNKLTANISDDDKIDSVSVLYSQSKDGEWKTLKTFTPKTKTYSLSVELKDGAKALEEGVYFVKIEVWDKDGIIENGSKSSVSGPFVLAVDNGAPKITVNTLSGDFKSSDFEVKGSIDKKSSLLRDGIEIKVTEQDGKFVWTDSFTGQTEGKTVTYSAKDSYGQEGKSEFSFKIDKNKPTVEESWAQSESEKEWTNKTSKTFKIPLSDTYDVVNKTEFNQNNFSTIDTATLEVYKDGVQKSLVPMTKTSEKHSNSAYDYYSGTAVFDESGVYEIKLFVKDFAGNTLEYEKPLSAKIDLTSPDVSALKLKSDKIGSEENAELTEENKFTAEMTLLDSDSGIGKILFSDGLKQIYDSTSSDAQKVSLSKNETGVYTFSFDKSLLTTGSHNFKVTVYDNAGNSVEKSFNALSVDVTPPVIKVNDASPYVMVESQKIYNGKISFSGILTDETALDTSSSSVEWEILDFEKNPLQNPVKGSEKVSNSPSGDFKIELDTTKVTENSGIYYLKLTGRDNAGNLTYNLTEFKIDQETDIPNVTITPGDKSFTGTPDKENNLFGMGSNVIYVTVTDDDELQSVKYKINGTEHSVTLENTKTSLSFDIDLSKCSEVKSGENTLDIVATDINGKSSLGSSRGVNGMNFAYDDDVPVASVEKINETSYSSNMLTGSSVSLKIKAIDSSSDDGRGLSVYCTKVEKKNSSVYENVVYDSEKLDWNEAEKCFVHEFTETEENDFRRTYEVLDKYERKTSVQVLYRVDMGKPRYDSAKIKIEGENNTPNKILSIDKAAETDVWFKTSSIKISGDEEAFIESHPAKNIVTVSGVDYPFNLGKNNSFSTTVSLSEGNQTAILKGTDEAGNDSELLTINVKIDTILPQVTGVTFEKNGKTLNDDTLTVIPTATDEGSGIAKILVGVKPNFLESEAIGEGSVSGEEIICTMWSASEVSKQKFDGNYTIYVRCVDKAGNVSSDFESGSFVYDRTPPKVEIKSPVNLSSVYKKITVSGTVEDNNLKDANSSLPKPYIYQNGNWQVLNTVYSGSVFDEKISANEWSFTVDTEKIFPEAVTGSTENIKIAVVIEDKAGNSSLLPEPASYSLEIDQYKDRPQISFFEIEGESGSVKKYTASITGTVSDLDGLKEFKVSDEEKSLEEWKAFAQPEGTLEFNPSNGGFTYTPSDSLQNTKDGEKKLYFYVKDSKDTEFYTQTLSIAQKKSLPYIKFKGNSSLIDNNKEITYKVDGNTPEIESLEFIASDNEALLSSGVFEKMTSSVILGGIKKRYVKFTLSAFDTNGIDIRTGSVQANIGGKPVTFTHKETSGQKSVFESEIISFENSEYRSGDYNFIISVKDTSGLLGTKTYSFKVDNDSPEIKVMTPKPKDNSSFHSEVLVYGDVSISGTAMDSYSPVSLVKYLVKDNSTPSEESQIISLIKADDSQTNSGSENAWTFLFDGDLNIHLPDTPDKLLSDYSNFKNEGSDIYTLSVYLYAEDNLGNGGLEEFKITYDPYEDRPKTEVLYPSNGDIVSGTVRVSGSAKDNTTVKAVYIQIRPKGKTAYTWAEAKDWLSGLGDAYKICNKNDCGITDGSADPDFWGLECSGTASWSKEINSGSNLESSVTETLASTDDKKEYAIEVRSCAVDEGGKLGSWSLQTVTMTINPNAPAFGTDAKYLSQYNGGTESARLEYSNGIYLKDQWYIVVSVQHLNGIKELSFSTSENGTSYSNQVILVQNSNATVNLKDYTLDGTDSLKENMGSGSDKGYILKLPIGKSSGTGESHIKIEATSGGDVSGNMIYSVNYDNEAPLIENIIQNDSPFTENVKLLNSDGRLEIGSTVQDSGSGFSKALFYFTRKIGSSGKDAYTRMYDPMINSRSEPYYRESDNNSIGIDILNDSGEVVSGIEREELSSGSFIYGKKYSVTRGSSDSLTIADANPHIRVGNLVKIGGTYHTLKSVSNDGKTFSFTPACDENYTDAFFPYAQVVDNTGSETLKTVTDTEFVFKSGDDGDGMPETVTKTGSTWKWTADIHANFIPDGPVTFHLFVFDESGNVKAESIDCEISTSAPRLAKLFLGTDLSGNGSFEKDEFEEYNIRNVSGVYQSDFTLKTSRYETVTVSGEGTVKVEQSERPAFKIKDQLAVVPEFTGGNGTIRMVYKKDDNSSYNNVDRAVKKSEGSLFESSQTVSISSIPIGSSNGLVQTVEKDAFVLSNSWIASGTESGGVSESSDGKDKYMSFTFWDSTEGLECGENSQNCYVQITDFEIDLVDSKAPLVIVDPFFWNGKGFAENASGFKPKNSLYYSIAGTSDEITNTVNGHIELESDLPSEFNSTGEYDKDPKVSGQIVIRGTAYDDVRLGELYVSFDDFALSGGLSGGSVSGYCLAAKYDSGTGLWESVGDKVSENGWGFKVLASDDVNASHTFMSQSGHSVDWEFFIDTAKIKGTCGLDKSFKILALDAKNKNQSAQSEVSKPDSTTTPYTTVAYTDKTYEQMNVPAYRMDVVPYISGIHTMQRTQSGLKDNNIRSASGKYSVIKGKIDKFITVNGFNLKNISSARIVSSSDLLNSLIGITSSSGTSLAVTTSSDKEMYFSNAGTKSGYLELFDSNGIRTLNNINNNDAHGTYALKGSGETALVSDYAYMPNRMNEADYTNTKNVTLTDDRYIRFFDMKDTGMKNGYYPVMVMNGDNPVFGYVNLSGGPATSVGTAAGTGAGAYQATNAAPQRAEFNAIDGTEVYTEYLVKQLASDQMAMAVDSDGRYLHATVFNYAGESMSLYYDRYNELSPANTGDCWGGNVAYTDYTGSRAYQSGNNAIGLDSVNYGSLLLGRYQYPKLIMKGNSKTDVAYVYMSYYDDNLGEILFRNFQIGKNVKGTRLSSSGTDSSGTTYAQKYNFTENTYNSDTWNSGRLTVTSSGSKYFAMGVTSDNHVVIGYYDESLSKIVLKYSTVAVTGANPTADVAWTTSTVSFPEYVGSYLSLAVDGNSVHLAAFDSYDSNLTYMYMPSYSGTELTSVTVDQSSSVGQWTQIKVKQNVPYISYYNSTETGSRDAIKIAYSNNPASTSMVGGVDVISGSSSGSGYTTGAWEYMTVPAITPPQGGDTKFQSVCLDFDTKGIPVVGYLGTNLEFGKWLDE